MRGRWRFFFLVSPLIVLFDAVHHLLREVFFCWRYGIACKYTTTNTNPVERIPLLLSCGHSFCKCCLHSMQCLIICMATNWYDVVILQFHRGFDVPCPQCRAIHNTMDQTTNPAACFKKNFALIDYIYVTTIYTIAVCSIVVTLQALTSFVKAW